MDFPPHLHLDMELLYVQKGWIAAQAGDGEYQVGAGELLFLIPNAIHAYRTLTPPEETGYLLIMAQPGCAGDYQNRLLTTYPVCPLVREEALHADVRYALNALSNGGTNQESQDVLKLFFQLILARILPVMEWENQEAIRVPQPDGTSDPIYFPALPRKFIAGDAVQPVRHQPLPSLPAFFPDDPHWILCISPFSAGQLRQGAAAKLQS